MPKRKKVHYIVHALHDGTILAACPDRKPPKCRLYPEEEDEDGVCRWHLTAEYDALGRWTTNPFGVAAVTLNVKKMLRSQVEAKLTKLNDQMTALKAQLDRIEAAIGKP